MAGVPRLSHGSPSIGGGGGWVGRPQSVAASSASELTRGFRRYRAAQLPAAQQSTRIRCPSSWIMTSIHEGLVKDWQRTQLAGYISKSLQIMRLSCSERRLAPLDSWIGQSGLRSLDVLIDGRHGRHMTKTKDALARRPYADLSVTAYLAATGRLRK